MQGTLCPPTMPSETPFPDTFIQPPMDLPHRLEPLCASHTILLLTRARRGPCKSTHPHSSPPPSDSLDTSSPSNPHVGTLVQQRVLFPPPPLSLMLTLGRELGWR